MAKTRSQSGVGQGQGSSSVDERPAKRVKVDSTPNSNTEIPSEVAPSPNDHSETLLDAHHNADPVAAVESEDDMETQMEQPRASDLYLDTVRESSP